LNTSFGNIATNGLGLCEEAELEAQMFSLALNPLFCKTLVGGSILSVFHFCD
jgi:hypothetical protein